MGGVCLCHRAGHPGGNQAQGVSGRWQCKEVAGKGQAEVQACLPRGQKAPQRHSVPTPQAGSSLPVPITVAAWAGGSVSQSRPAQAWGRWQAGSIGVPGWAQGPGEGTPEQSPWLAGPLAQAGSSAHRWLLTASLLFYPVALLLPCPGLALQAVCRQSS